MAAMALAGSTIGAASAAEPAPPAATAPNAVDARTVVDAVRQLVRDRYVIAETGAALDAALAKAQANGDFAGLSGRALAEAINGVMRSVTPDGHLGASYDPVRSADLAAHGGAFAGEDELTPAMIRMIALNNAGFRRMEVLPGNIRYVDHTVFAWGTPESESALANAMEFLRGGSAIIIDHRRMGGGAAEAVAAMASYFVPEGTPLMRFQTRGEEPEVSVSGAAPFSLAGKPVFVLTSSRTFSAGEEFAAHVDAFGFAKLVGETTGGGGFNNMFFALPGGHLISVSTSQALHARTGKGWERTGIAPAVAVPQDRALERAQAEAVAAMIPGARDGERQALEAILPVYRAMADGTAPANPPSTYLGRYGDRTIAVGADGTLTSQRGNGPATRLIALGGDTFAFEQAPAQRIAFVVENGSAAAVEVSSPAGPQRTPRNPG
ncbi:S41 family peptidase [Tsuneonella sp. YG55]|uniref:S41 family peptidase n=1 Tax=Tsuneonella litorea TaxID=2976475 RepID=A0A9X2VYI0_9SPHN|nr:S41 family peptidase [Tsuneonella litorea]MCT2557648.1 S41 family peptidase [Tsuneonella litorea]